MAPPGKRAKQSKAAGFQPNNPGGGVLKHPHVQGLQQRLDQLLAERQEFLQLLNRLEKKHVEDLRLEKEETDSMRWVKNFTIDLNTDQVMNLLKAITAKNATIQQLQNENQTLKEIAETYRQTQQQLLQEKEDTERKLQTVRKQASNAKASATQIRNAQQAKPEVSPEYKKMSEIKPDQRSKHRKTLDRYLGGWSGGDVVDGLTHFFNRRRELFTSLVSGVGGGKILYQLRLAVVQKIESLVPIDAIAALFHKTGLSHMQHFRWRRGMQLTKTAPLELEPGLLVLIGVPSHSVENPLQIVGLHAAEESLQLRLLLFLCGGELHVKDGHRQKMKNNTNI